MNAAVYQYNPSDVRVPTTEAEADAAVEYAEARLESLNERIERGPPPGHIDPADWARGVEAMRSKWAVKLAEMEYHRERLRSGTDDTAALYAAEYRRAEDAVAEVRRLRALVAAERDVAHVPAGHREELENLKRALEARNERIKNLTAESNNLREALAATPAAVERSQARRSYQDTLAYVLEALAEIEASGIALPPLARSLRRKCNVTISQKHLAEWRVFHLPAVREFAEALAADGGTDA